MSNLIWIFILLTILSIAFILVAIRTARVTSEEYFGITEIETEIIERELKKELKKIEVE